MYLTVFESSINDVPCLIGVTGYTPAIPGRLYGPWEDCYPAVPAEIEFTVLKLSERPYPWLEKQMTDRDYDRICDEIESSREN